MRVYLAAPYSEKELMKSYAERLRVAGIGVTSSWIEEPHAPKTQLHELSPVEHRRYAKRDLSDIDDADKLILFTDPTKAVIRAGRYVEFGFALALNKPIWVVGMEYENIFHYLGGITRFANWDDAFRALKQENA